MPQCKRCSTQTTIWKMALGTGLCYSCKAALDAGAFVGEVPNGARLIASASGTFAGSSVSGVSGNGRYRGPGSLSLYDVAIVVTGKRVHSLIQRWLLALAIYISGAIVTCGLFTLALPLCYWFVDRRWLQPGNQVIAMARIRGLAFDPEKDLLAIHFVGSSDEAPIVLSSSEGRAFYYALAELRPDIVRPS